MITWCCLEVFEIGSVQWFIFCIQLPGFVWLRGLSVEGGLFVHAFSYKIYFNGFEHIFLKNFP